MQKALLDILKEHLVGKRIKLYAVTDERSNRKYYITDSAELAHPRKCKITGESSGIIEALEAEHIDQEGDVYNINIVDDQVVSIHFNGLYSITSKFELI